MIFAKYILVLPKQPGPKKRPGPQSKPGNTEYLRYNWVPRRYRVAPPEGFDWEYELGRSMSAMRKYAESLTRDRDHADEVMGRTIEMIVAKIGKFTPRPDRPRHGFQGWALCLVHNCYINWTRSLRSDHVSFDDPASEGSDRRLHEVIAEEDFIDPARRIDARWEWQVVQEALTEMPQGMVDVLMFFLKNEDASYEDCARDLGLVIGTVRSRLARGRAMLRDLTGRPNMREPDGRANRGAAQALKAAA